MLGCRKSDSVKVLFEFIEQIKSREMRSNCVFSTEKIKELNGRGKLWVSVGEQAAIILFPDTENIVRLYYYAKNKDALGEIKSLLPECKETIICDVVGREPKSGEQATELEENGFYTYAVFQRMMCTEIRVDPALNVSDVQPALLSDAEEIFELLHQEFDRLTARFFSLDTLKKRISDNEVFVIRKDGKIAAFTIFDSRNKQVATLEYVITRAEYRNQKLARKILSYKWSRMNTSNYYVLWINKLCAGPIRSHEKNGYHTDGMYDYILLLKEPD